MVGDLYVSPRTLLGFFFGGWFIAISNLHFQAWSANFYIIELAGSSDPDRKISWGWRNPARDTMSGKIFLFRAIEWASYIFRFIFRVIVSHDHFANIKKHRMRVWLHKQCSSHNHSAFLLQPSSWGHSSSGISCEHPISCQYCHSTIAFQWTKIQGKWCR